MQVDEQRQALIQLKRVVVKVGTRVLVDRRGRPDPRRMDALVQQLVRLRACGREVVLVSSGAIGAGIEALKMKRRPHALPDLQMAAAVGQSRLMARYQQLFARKGCTIGQVLLTHDDLRHRVRHLNARNTVMNLLRHGIVPIVNENDVVSVDELRVGDNDQLASLVTMLVDAELLVLLSSTNGLRAPAGNGGRTRRVTFLPRVTERELQWSWGRGSKLSIGGMTTKLQAAQAAVDTGAAALIADGRKADVLDRVFAGDDVGTLIGHPGHLRSRGALASKKRWIAFFQRAQGRLVVDDGAARAIAEQGRSLLPIGIRQVDGQFDIGAMVSVDGLDGRHVARGLVEYSAAEIDQIKGHRTGEIARLLGSCPYDEVIHRDNMVVFDSR
jgi:glutamate 5-kinase